MLYVSTRGAAPRLGFEEAMLAGLARDGGLYVPEAWPEMSRAEIAALAGLPYAEAAFRVMRPFVGDAFTDDEFRAILDARLCGLPPPGGRAAAPARPERLAARAVPRPDARLQGRGDAADRPAVRGEPQAVGPAHHHRRRHLGDTGSAAIEAFRGRAGVEVFILFPDGRVSEVQRRQMTTPTEAERPRARHRRRLRRRPGAASRTCSTTTPSATASASPGSTRSTGRGCWRRPSTTSPPPSRSARRTGRSASPCRPATSATSSPAGWRSAWACRSTGW